MRRIAREIPQFDHFKFLSKIITGKDGDCWNWSGYTEKGRYSRFDIKMQNGKFCWFYAHRLSFFIFNGKIDNSLVIDHICKNRGCANPDHLRQVTNEYNVIENSVGPLAKHSKKTHCPLGHEYTGSNLGKSKRGRYCKSCTATWNKRRYEAKKLSKQ